MMPILTTPFPLPARQSTVFQHASSLLSDLANERTSDEDVNRYVPFSFIEDSDSSLY